MSNPEITPKEREAGAALLACIDNRPITLASLRRVMLLLTRTHWSQPSNHGDLASNFSCLAYDAEFPDKSTLPIYPIEDYMEEKSECPAIYIGQREAPFKPVSIGSAHGNMGSSDDNSTTYHGWNCETIAVAGCVHRSIEMAQLMAESTMVFWSGVGPILSSRMGLRMFQPLGISAAVKQETSPVRSYRVDVTAQMIFTWSVALSLESHRLKYLMHEINPVQP